MVNNFKIIIPLVDSLLFSYSTLIFMHSRLVGIILLAATFLNINIAVLGMVSWITTIIFARLIGVSKTNILLTIYTYNSLIVGFAIGFLFKISFLAVLMTMGASVLTFLISFTLFSFLTLRHGLPVLNLPFFIVTTMIYLGSVRYSSLFVESFYAHEMLNFNFLPVAVQGFLRTMGVLIFMPYDLIGILILSALLLFSRISFCMAIISYYLGIGGLVLLKGSFTAAYTSMASFNFILIGIALGGIFLIPSRRTYLLALIGVFIAVFILDAVAVFWSTYGIPVLTLPFNIVVLLFVHVLTNIGYPEINTNIMNSPEESLANYLSITRRFDHTTPKPLLPFSGQWTIYQGFDDQWTHQGPWKYAYDFVIKNAQGQSFRSQGTKTDDYYCFGKPVLAPVSGTVIDAGDQLPDNPIGEVDGNSNWGNYIIIYSPFGYYVEISHLQHKSLQIKAGDSVKAGAIIAKCGNSGYSPEPHIHLQIQYQAQLGAQTAPFFLGGCRKADQTIVGRSFLPKNTVIEPLNFSKKMLRCLQFILDDEFSYSLYKNQEEVLRCTLQVKMALNGSFYFALNGHADRLYFGIEDNFFYFYSFEGHPQSPLKLFFTAMPRVPLTEDSNLRWDDILPAHNHWTLLNSFNHNDNITTGQYWFTKNNEIRGAITNKKLQIITLVELDSAKGINRILLEQKDLTLELRRLKA